MKINIDSFGGRVQERWVNQWTIKARVVSRIVSHFSDGLLLASRSGGFASLFAGQRCCPCWTEGAILDI